MSCSFFFINKTYGNPVQVTEFVVEAFFLSTRSDIYFSLPIQILASLFQDRQCWAELVVEALAALKERQLGDSLALLVEARRRAEKEYQVEYPTMEMK